jgi:hypothetical protein
MSNQEKKLLARLLGEVYRLQKAQGVRVPFGDDIIYGLLRGIEEALEQAIPEDDDWLGTSKINAVRDILEPYFTDPAKLASFKGFYDIEQQLQARDVDRSDAIAILKYLNASGQYQEVIQKMNSNHSPSECRKFELDEFDC